MKPLFALIAAMAMTSVHAAPFTVSTDGQEVTDQATGLIWRRCAEGMSWSGTTCTGSALTLTHENALVRARTEAVASSKAWRLPNVKELGGLADRSRVNPAIDITAFPATPSTSFWSSSPYAGDASYAWGVVFSNGYVSVDDRSDALAVRLVRASQ